MALFYLSAIKIMFAFMTAFIIIFSCLINCFERQLPTSVVQTFRYGKIAYKKNRSFIVNFFELPKSWFKHFYVVATIFSTLTFILAVTLYAYDIPAPAVVFNFLDLVGSRFRSVTTNATSVTVALVLLTLQTWRRLYETFFVSVYSNSKINITHYTVGILHYIGTVLAIIVEAPSFAYPNINHTTTLTMSDFTWLNIIGASLFLWAWYHQYKAAVILANLRKDKKGKITSLEHKMPNGDLFEGVSSPHMFCEVIMYLSLYIILWGNTTWPYVFLWVFCNQCETAFLNHWWYKENFQSYPTRRKAFIPFIL